MKNILILEDDMSCNKLLINIISNCRENVSVYSAIDEKEAMQLAMECYIDLFLIDISLHGDKANDASGVTFAKKIRKIEHYEITPMIFVTSVANLELHTYREVSCYSYILKPLDSPKQEKLLVEMDKLLRSDRSQSRDDYYYFKIDSIYYPIKISEIITIKCQNRKLLVHTVRDEFTVSNLTLKQVMKELNQNGCNPFVQCHRGILVNLDYIDYIDKVNKYLKVEYEEEMIDFANTKWLSKFQGVVRHDR